MASRTVVLLTNTVYGDSTYETDLWKGVSQESARTSTPLITVAGGQLTADDKGAAQVPFLFQIASRFRPSAVVINGGTLEQGLPPPALDAFIRQFPSTSKVVTAISPKGVPSVVVDNFAGMRGMVDHVVGPLNRRHPLYISGPYSNGEATERLRAFRETLQARGMAVSGSDVWEGTWMGPSAALAIREAVSKKVPFDAVICANDLMAVAVVEELQALGLRVPEDVVVSGFDDIEAARFCRPPLSTVFQPIPELGARALAMALADTQTEQAKVPARIVFRNTAPERAEGGDSGAHGLAELRSHFGGEAGLLGIVEAVETKTLGEAVQAVDRFLEGADDTRQQLFARFLGELKRSVPASASEVVLAIVETHRDHLVRVGYNGLKQNESMMTALVRVNRVLNQVGRLDALEPAVAEAFAGCGIQGCSVVLLDGPSGAWTGARRIIHVAGGTARGAEREAVFPLTSALPEGSPKAGAEWLILPLTFEEQDLGYVVFDRAEVSPFMYEALANLLAGILHSLLLIGRVQQAEGLAASRADKIGELVRPMIASIQETGSVARDQGSVMEALVTTNTESAARLSSMDTQVGQIRTDLNRVMDLIGSIEEVAETISVIAINASIAAARAGANGRVFGVISAEIRRLSIQTKENTAQIANVLSNLDTNAQGFLDSSRETRAVFTRLEGEIQHLLSSLNSIQTAMGAMDGQAQQVLQTME